MVDQNKMEVGSDVEETDPDKLTDEALAKILKAGNDMTEAASLLIKSGRLRLDNIERGVIEDDATKK